MKRAIALATLALLAPTPLAHTDGMDSRFWEELQSLGLTSAFSSQADAIASAKAVCHMLNTGRTEGSTAVEVAAGLGIHPSKVAEFVGASIAAYCPSQRNAGPGG
jgi:hypothetical protein